jgi:hypothetical protein
MNWIINEDARYLCPNDPTLPRRYSLAVFYFSTRGNRWLQCSAPEDLSDPVSIQEANDKCTIEPVTNSGSDAWLTPGSECGWGGVVCENGEVSVLDLGEYFKRTNTEFCFSLLSQNRFLTMRDIRNKRSFGNFTFGNEAAFKVAAVISGGWCHFGRNTV